MATDWKSWAARLIQSLSQPQSAPIPLPAFKVADLPSAGQAKFHLIMVSDESGGAVPAFSDGTNWRRVTDRVVVS